jgi:hypothetical protein
MQEGESSVSDHTGLHPIILHSELEQLFSLIGKTVCFCRKYMCNANVYGLHGMTTCIIKLLFFLVTFIMILVRTFA